MKTQKSLFQILMILSMIMSVLAGCQASGHERESVTILAAASLTEPLNQIKEDFMAIYPEVTIETSYAGSQVLAGQIEAGAECDLFLSANMKYATQISESMKIDSKYLSVFSKNQLVIVTDAATMPDTFEVLMVSMTSSDYKIVVAHKDVPVGKYTQQFFDAYRIASQENETAITSLENQIVSYESDVKSVLTKVRQHEGDMGLVYGTDLYGIDLAKEGLNIIPLPETYAQIATYGAVIMNQDSMAQVFYDYLMSSEGGQKVLKKYGFLTE